MKMLVRQFDWPAAAAVPAPGADETHVWSVDLDRHAARHDEFSATLAPDERARAERFRRAGDAARFVVARGVLRRVLAGYLGTSPRGVEFCYRRFGKPALAAAGENASLSFNLAHAGGRALVAVARGRELGVDLEAVTHDFDLAPLAARVFSPAERAELAALAEDARRPAFYRGWTRKEALLKALGRGLTGAPQAFTVSLAPDAKPQRLQLTGDGRAGGWSLIELPIEAEFAAALAVEGTIGAVSFV